MAAACADKVSGRGEQERIGDSVPGTVRSRDDLDAAEDSEDEDTVRKVIQKMKETPSYPFPAEFNLEHSVTHIGVIQHLCSRHPTGTRAIALFFPGVHGGVGPCRTPGMNFDENALYPTVAKTLAASYDIDCYRCSWPFMRPNMSHAIGGACRVLHYAVRAACGDESAEESASANRELKVVFVGHSMGGAVIMRSAEVAARYLNEQTLDGAKVSVAGICTLNGAVDVHSMLMEATSPREELEDWTPEEVGQTLFGSLTGTRGLFICGDEDQIVPHEATLHLHSVVPCHPKRCLTLPNGTHDLFGHKEIVVRELTEFIVAACGQS
eukprot:TRINITY_DN49453_c0_g1_i1.p1 TRINITY_DN49453_c0_g1~~TRINITY_DN49453_c0_g1_i1.p1  ORF type:complete len:324 (+),score=56.83 TRINITY_DN49453_c0_g1_i1:136-1107(+)